jgi:microsomal dipeptidase-like Zn-dependent dipeptidase
MASSAKDKKAMLFRILQKRLNDFDKQLVKRMNELGMIVDIVCGRTNILGRD